MKTNNFKVNMAVYLFMELFLTRDLNVDIEILITWFLLFLRKLFLFTGAMYRKDLMQNLTVFIFGMWSYFSFLMIYELTDTFF